MTSACLDHRFQLRQAHKTGTCCHRTRVRLKIRFVRTANVVSIFISYHVDMWTTFHHYERSSIVVTPEKENINKLIELKQPKIIRLNPLHLLYRTASMWLQLCPWCWDKPCAIDSAWSCGNRDIDSRSARQFSAVICEKKPTKHKVSLAFERYQRFAYSRETRGVKFTQI